MKRTNRPPEDRSLGEILFGAYRGRVLAALLLHPDEAYHVRELSRVTGVPVGSLHRELRLLSAAGILVRSSAGNQVRFAADRSNPIFEEIASILRKTVGIADVLRDALAPLAPQIRLALVFGSIAAAREAPGSDIDVLIVGSVSFAQVVEAVSPAQERLRREINPVVFTPEELAAKLKRRDRFLMRIAREPKIFLIGVPRDFAEPAEDRAT
jgi:predicted nucleotidyltransferase